MSNRIVYRALRDRLWGVVYVTGPPLRRMSKCLLCGLDSGPWLTRHAAAVSGLLHLTGHHACMGDPGVNTPYGTAPGESA